jgi:hypothetical protein
MNRLTVLVCFSLLVLPATATAAPLERLPFQPVPDGEEAGRASPLLWRPAGTRSWRGSSADATCTSRAGACG